MRSDLIIKLLETAGHDTTPEQEALAALRQIKKQLNGTGKGFRDIVSGAQPVVQVVEVQATNPNANVPYRRWVERVSELEEEIKARDAKKDDSSRKIRELEQEVERLKRNLEIANNRLGDKRVRKMNEPIDKRSDDDMSYAEWSLLVVNKIGTNRAWQMAVERFTANSKNPITRSQIQRWSGNKIVPAFAVEAVENIVITEDVEPKLEWTATKVAQVRALVDQRKSEKEIAAILSKKWGIRVTDNNIKRLKHDSRCPRIRTKRKWEENGWGPPIGKSRDDK